jgi:DNA-binding PadR family transcriptional regulator
MHRHQLSRLAEKDHVQDWTDMSVGAIPGAIKRQAAEKLIKVVRSERDGAHPERQVYDITGEGRVTLSMLKRQGIREVLQRADPLLEMVAGADAHQVWVNCGHGDGTLFYRRMCN